MLDMSAIFYKRLSKVPGVEQELLSWLARLTLSGWISGVNQGSAWLKSFSHQCTFEEKGKAVAYKIVILFCNELVKSLSRMPYLQHTAWSSISPQKNVCSEAQMMERSLKKC